MLTSYLPAPSLVTPLGPSATPVYALSAVTSGVTLPAFAVSSAAPQARIENRLQGGVSTPAPLPAETEAATVSAAPASAAALLPGGNSAAPRFSSPFLAQLIGQFSPQESATLAGQFVVEGEPTSVLDVRLLDLFSQIKYKPSNASKPMQPVSNVQVLFKAAEMSSRREGLVVRSEVQAPLMQAANGNLRLPAASNDNARNAPRPEPTLARASGFSAYVATVRRNDAIREPVPEAAPATGVSVPDTEQASPVRAA